MLFLQHLFRFQFIPNVQSPRQKDRGEPDLPQREFEIAVGAEAPLIGAEATLKPTKPAKEHIDSEPQIAQSVPIDDQTKGDIIAIGAEGQLKDTEEIKDKDAIVGVAEQATLKPTKELIDSVPQISPSAPIGDKDKGDDVEVAEEAEIKDTEEIKDKDAIVGVAEEAPLKAPTKEPIDSEPQISPSTPIGDKDIGDDVEVAEEAPLKPKKPDKGVDSATFLIRGHEMKSCAWLEKKADRATRKWCKQKAFKKNQRGEYKPKVWEYCGKTCCDAGVTEACAEDVL